MTNSSCKVCAALDSPALDNDDKRELRLSMSTGDVSKVTIAYILTNNGFEMTEASVRRHVKNHGRG